MNTQLNPYLPTAQEIEKMSRGEFDCWISKAHRELRRREEERDPLFHLQKQISRILERKDISEEQREAIVWSELERYERIISQPQREKLT